jgi:hypothetical protein
MAGSWLRPRRRFAERIRVDGAVFRDEEKIPAKKKAFLFEWSRHSIIFFASESMK